MTVNKHGNTSAASIPLALDDSNKKGLLKVEVLKGQESFKIKSFTRANTWALFRSGKSIFKKGELIECFYQLG